ncbi:YtrH family sporulation protein [Bacillus carboniphilus]|uniref:YtrH family sporulation protein n=1 Tax=Bacillus carboniphilus TaxID=86663 RepID=A0ABY9JXS0_9BACI|nr:YtrH family sporulation protein [Bacillus carboniphilus]WLR44171.1 YtrH family sporulation protein [Bacillus carboniphilus]
MENEAFIPFFIHSFFIALGVILGGALIGGIGAYLTGDPPLSFMFRFANRLKIWALVAAIGGTFDAFSNFERGLFQGASKDLFKQFLVIVSAMGGAQTGWMIIAWLTQEE